VVRGFQFGLTAGMFGMELIGHIKSYVYQTKDNSPQKKRKDYVYGLFNKSEDSHPLYRKEFTASQEIIDFFLSSPTLGQVTLLGYHDMDELKPIDRAGTDSNRTLILFKKHDQKFAWDISTIKGIVISSEIYMEFTDDEAFTKLLTVEYIKSLDFQHNVLYDMDDHMASRPRSTVKEVITQFDVPKFISEIRKVLEIERKRAYAFIGRPGVGKTLIMKKIEEIVTEYPIVYLTPADFRSPASLTYRFSLIRTIEPVIVMVEDLDSCGLDTKNNRTGAFLSEIDNTAERRMVIIVTLNNAAMVHKTILDRPGRFDRVFEVLTPQNITQVKQIISSKMSVIGPAYYKDFEADGLADLNEDILKKFIDHKFTQAEIANAVEQSLLDMSLTGTECTVSTFLDAMKTSISKHMETKRILKEYHFEENRDPSNDVPDEAAISRGWDSF